MFFSVCLLGFSLLPFCGAVKSGIIGGNEAKAHSRPYMVSFQMNNKHKCGGLLIRRDYVLTAAHCIDDIEGPGTNKLEVVLGAHNISQKEKQQQRIQVQKCIKHPCYKKNERPNDIMLLKLKTKAKQSNAVKVGVLPKENENLPANQKCSIAGWGWTKQSSAESSVLREGDSGSPLICGNVAEGIAAYTHRINCIDRNYPQVYMKISNFLPWIKQVIG